MRIEQVQFISENNLFWSQIERRNVQAAFVWRHRPPFGVFQLVYQKGTAAFGERSKQGDTFFVKVSWPLSFRGRAPAR